MTSYVGLLRGVNLGRRQLKMDDLKRVAARLGYENVFRVIIMQFIDAHAFDVRSVKKSCVHIVHPHDGRLIPFDTYNLFYRDELESTRLAPLRETADITRLAVMTGQAAVESFE